MYTLVIENNVKVPVKFETNNGGKGRSFHFNLICDRLSQNEIDKLHDEGDVLISDVVKRITQGWENQALVVDVTGKPVEFSEEAFDVMLGLTGLARVIWQSYQKEVGAKTKN